ncbi:hypothetical protein UAJ10_00555 [Nitrospirillum sp. BR 11164]|nr:hypothetical protein [Nitrospirillum sp. BR 11164]MEA1647504.1 hypothetical protein [Nitrospirillum sp. BR 11164]
MPFQDLKTVLMVEGLKTGPVFAFPIFACHRDCPDRRFDGGKSMSFKKIVMACLVLVGVGVYATSHMTAERKVAMASPIECQGCEPW